MELNGLLGRPPDGALVLAPLPEPTAPEPTPDGWQAAPELAHADRAVAMAEAEVRVERNARAPHLDVVANAGAEPVLGSSFDAPANTGRGVGVEGMVEMSWPLLDWGVTRARVGQARQAATQQAQVRALQRHDVELAWSQARADLDQLAGEIETYQILVPIARDAYLYEESAYRGGAGNGLEVLDAFDAWTEAELQVTSATLEFRVASAQLDRWEGR